MTSATERQTRRILAAQVLLAAACVTAASVGAVWLVRWLGPNVSFGWGVRSDERFRRHVVEPLRNSGAVAIAIALIGPVVAWQWRRRTVVVVCVAMGVIVASAAILAAGHTQSRQRDDLRPELALQLAQLRVPAVWQRLDLPQSEQDPPSVFAAWLAIGVSPDAACEQLRDSVASWTEVNPEVLRRPQSDRRGECVIVANLPNGREVSATVDVDPGSLGRTQPGYRAVFESRISPLVGVQLTYNME